MRYVARLCSLSMLLNAVSCAPGIDDPSYGTAQIGESCADPVDCADGLLCRNGSCTKPGSLPIQWGSIEDDLTNAIAVDSKGDIYVGGHTTGALGNQTGLGKSDSFLTKISPEGTVLWHRQFGGAGRDAIVDIAPSSSGKIYLTGFSDGDPAEAFLAQYTEGGEELWLRRWGTYEGDMSTSVAVDEDEKIYVCGCLGCTNLMTTLSFPEENIGAEAFVARYDENGEQVWIETWNDHDDDRAISLALDDKGDIFVGGYFAQYAEEAQSVIKWSSYAFKFSSEGEEMLEIALEGSDFEQNNMIQSIATDEEGNLYLAGAIDVAITFDPTANIFVSKWSNNGERLWLERLGGPLLDWPFDIAVTDESRVFVTGSTYNALQENTQRGFNDAFLAEYSGEGATSSTEMWGSPENDVGIGLAVGAQGSLYLTGNTAGSLFENGNQGGYDVFLLEVE